jgi:putative ABC transport system substrate-binding protein
VRRREFITLVGGAAATAWPLAARAQKAGKVFRIGFLGSPSAASLPERNEVAARAQPGSKRPIIGFLGTATALAWSNWVASFVERLQELGWVDGRTVAIEYRWADGRSERFSEIAAEFVRLKVDVIVTSGVAVPPVKQATSVIPIVFAVASDPIGPGMVANLARPGHNITGLSLQAPDLAGKRLGLLREVVPGLRRLAVLANAGNPAAELEMREVEAMSGGLGFEFCRAQNSAG